MVLHTYEGSPRELSQLLAQRPNGRFRLIELGDDITDDEAALPDPKNAASIALLKSWIAQAPTDPEEIRRAERELADFKRNMNANRATAGERLPYPEVEE
jgi:hypothetical protein